MKSLVKAMAAFIANGGDRCAMDVNAWALTYGVGTEQVREAWELQKWKSTTTERPKDNYGEGK